MWAPHQTPPPVEKIRKAQWTAENTTKTQVVVTRLETARAILTACGLGGEVTAAIDMAVARFRDLDAAVKMSDDE